MTINPNKCVACGNCTYVCPMGAIYIDPKIRRATINRDECVECYACYNGLSQEHLNPTMVRTMRKVFQMMRLRFDPEPDVCPTAAFEPDELQLAARCPPRVFRSSRTSRIDRRGRPRHRRSEDQRRVRPRAGGRGRVHDRVRPSRRRSVVQRYSDGVSRACGCRRSLREEESDHVA